MQSRFGVFCEDSHCSTNALSPFRPWFGYSALDIKVLRSRLGLWTTSNGPKNTTVSFSRSAVSSVGRAGPRRSSKQFGKTSPKLTPLGLPPLKLAVCRPLVKDRFPKMRRVSRPAHPVHLTKDLSGPPDGLTPNRDNQKAAFPNGI